MQNGVVDRLDSSHLCGLRVDQMVVETDTDVVMGINDENETGEALSFSSKETSQCR